MVSYLSLLSILFVLAIIAYAPVVLFGRIRSRPKWHVGRNYLVGLTVLLALTSVGLYKAVLDLSLASVARTADTKAVGRLLDLGASPNARYEGISALQNAYDRRDGDMIHLLEGAGATPLPDVD